MPQATEDGSIYLSTVEYADGTSSNVTSSVDLVWNISDTDIATISKDDVVTGVSIGVTRIKRRIRARRVPRKLVK